MEIFFLEKYLKSNNVVLTMGKIRVKVDDSIERESTCLAEETFGPGQANICIAFDEAINQWMQEKKSAK